MAELSYTDCDKGNGVSPVLSSSHQCFFHTGLPYTPGPPGSLKAILDGVVASGTVLVLGHVSWDLYFALGPQPCSC